MIAEAPWTDEQVAKLNEWQTCGWVHPFTCIYQGDGLHTDTPTGDWPLVAKTEGWECPFCGYHQSWAHDFMLEGPPPRPTVAP